MSNRAKERHFLKGPDFASYPENYPPLVPGTAWERPTFAKTPFTTVGSRYYQASLDTQELTFRLNLLSRQIQQGQHFRLGRYRIFTEKVLFVGI